MNFLGDVMVTVGFLSCKKKPAEMKSVHVFAAAALAEGAGFVFFCPDVVDFQRRKINGYVYDNSKWKRAQFRFPDAIYDALECTEESHNETVTRLRREIPFTSPSADYRQTAYDSLMRSKEFSRYMIPEKKLLSEKGVDDTAQQFINCVTKNDFTYDLKLRAQKIASEEWVVMEVYQGIAEEGREPNFATVKNAVCYSIHLAKKKLKAAEKNRVVFLGTHKSGSSMDAIAAAKSLNLYTVLLTDNPSHIEKQEDFACVDQMRFCGLDDLEEIRREISLFSDIRAIVSFTEEHCLTASIVAKEAGLVYFSPDAIEIMRDKIKTRNAIKDTPYSPFFSVIGCEWEMYETEGKLPLILKEPNSSGSKGVIRVDTREDLIYALNEIKKRTPDTEALIEEHLDGPQFLVETLTERGKVHIIAIVEQEISRMRRYIVTGYKVITSHETEFFNSLKKAAKEITAKLGMENGPCHLEMKYVNGRWKLIEANPRMSGAGMNLLIETAYGINLAMETLKMALGQKIELGCKYKREAFAQYVTVEKEGVLVKVTGKAKARKSEGVVHVYIKPRKGQLLIPPLSMGNRYAFVIATGKTSGEAMANAKRAANEINFYTKEIDDDIWEMLPQTHRDALHEIRTKSNG